MDFLIRRFVRDPERVDDPAVRGQYGKLAGTTGIGVNLFLFLIKLLAGLLSGSLAIAADAFNNLADAGSSIVTLVGFRLSSAPPDKEHPFGHGRMEYITALAVAAVIMLAGVELGMSAVDKILTPSATVVSWLTIVILLVSIIVKLLLMAFYKGIGGRIHSTALTAAATDSRNDVVCTSVVLLTSLCNLFFGLELDGYIGLLVAMFVLWSGFSIIRETVSPLLGQAPDPDMVRGIKETVLSFSGIVGIHELVVHDYGPGRLMISLHAEVPCEEDALKSHDIIDQAEQALKEHYNAIACIHMDPIDTSDPQVVTLRDMVRVSAAEVDGSLTVHDFRVVFGDTHTNLIFDVAMPIDYKGLPPAALCDAITAKIKAYDQKLNAVMTIEREFS